MHVLIFGPEGLWGTWSIGYPLMVLDRNFIGDVLILRSFEDGNWYSMDDIKLAQQVTCSRYDIEILPGMELCKLYTLH